MTPVEPAFRMDNWIVVTFCLTVVSEQRSYPVTPMSSRLLGHIDAVDSTRRILDARAFVLVFQAVVLLAAFEPLPAQDIVTIATGEEREGRTRVSGVIVDYTGAEIRVLLSGGRENVTPSDRIVEIQSTWTDEQLAGDRLYAEGKFADALKQYKQAVTAERRRWARRRILAQITWCSRSVGDIETAAVTFLQLLSSDRTTQYFDAIPLAWRSEQPPALFQNRAESWLDGESGSAAALVGASWLLATSQRAQAMAALERLSNDSDARIAHLADAQIWRTAVVTANEQRIGQWQAQIQKMPFSVRAGPHFTSGLALARIGRHDEAALALMRVPILYPENRHLAAEALHAAAGALEQLGRRDESAGLYREIVSKHADSHIAAESAARLKALTRDPD